MHLLLTLSLIFLSSCYAFAQSKINPFTGKPDLVGTSGSGSYTNSDAQSATGWVDSSTTVRLTTLTDNVGIGTSSSAHSLYVFNGNVGIGTVDRKLLLNGRSASYQAEMFVSTDTNNSSVDATYITSPASGGRIFFGRSGKGAYAVNMANVTNGFESLPILTVTNYLGHTYGRYIGGESGQQNHWQSYYGWVIKPNMGTSYTNSYSGIGGFDDWGLLIAGQNAATKQFAVRGATSQTGNLTEWQDSSANVLGSVNKDGNIGIGTSEANSGKLIISGGNVGIGSLTPGKQLDVQGTVRATYFVGDGSGLTGVSGGTSGWTLGASNVGISTTNNVGIGSSTPTQKLDVVGTIRATSFVGSGSGASSLFLPPTDSPDTCNAGAKGTVYYDASLSEMCDCDGSSWAQVDGGGAC